MTKKVSPKKVYRVTLTVSLPKKMANAIEKQAIKEMSNKSFIVRRALIMLREAEKW